MNQSIICWKWDDSSIEGDYLAKARELTERFHGDTICIAAHWVHLAFDDPKLIECFRQCADYFHSIGKKLCVEACIRNEGERFFQSFPKDQAWLSHKAEIVLDDEGNGEITLDIEPVYHYWRIAGTCGPQKVMGAWALNKTSDICYRPESLTDIKDRVWIQINTDESGQNVCRQVNYGGEIKTDAGCCLNTLHVRGGKENAGKTAVVMVGTLQPIPDLASEHLMEHYRVMIQAAKTAHVDGVFSDEWGYDVILKIEEVNPYDDNNLFLRHLSVSDAMADKYARRFEGRSLYEDLLSLYYAPEGEEQVSVSAINRYILNLRKIMADNDRQMHGIAKEILGKDTFYGIHPTWWGSVDSLNFEIFKNGFYWWEAVRDVAQTDETVIVPIRTALAHKWGSGIWYNMWYSMGTLDINTYFRETWNNLRFGGRTHYHGFECLNEGVVLELRKPGLLEQIEAMDARVRMVEDYQVSQPDSRVLVLFGMEAVSNWRLCQAPHPNWAPQNVKLDYVLNTAAKLFDTLLFDLVPTSEIAGKSLTVKDGRAVYGTQVYDTVVVLLPESMDRSCYEYLRQLSPDRLLIYGSATIYNDGEKVSENDLASLCNGAKRQEALPSPQELAQDILGIGVEANRWDNGCRFQDGSVIFTGSGEKNVGNPLALDTVIDGHHVQFKGEDFVFLKFNGDQVEVCTPAQGELTIDGCPYVFKEEA